MVVGRCCEKLKCKRHKPMTILLKNIFALREEFESACWAFEWRLQLFSFSFKDIIESETKEQCRYINNKKRKQTFQTNQLSFHLSSFSVYFLYYDYITRANRTNKS
jgi:hypothetical protein